MSGRVLCLSARMRLYHEFESGMVVINVSPRGDIVEIERIKTEPIASR